MEKKVYEEPSVTMVEFDFSEAITMSVCLSPNDFDAPCFD